MVKLKLLLLGFLLPFLGVAQILDPVSWSTSVEETNGKTFLVVTASIEKGWHLYSQYLESDMGPVPTEFTYEASPNYELVGKASESKTHTEYDKNFDMNLSFFSGKAVFKQEIKVKVAEPFKITGEVYYMVCDDEKCLPPTGEALTFDVSPQNKKQTENIDQVTETVEESAVEVGNQTEEIAPKSQGIHDPVVWSFSSKKIGENEYEVRAKAIIEPHWHVYATKLESEDGPIATEFVINGNDKSKIESVSEITEQGKTIDSYDPNFAMQLQYYEDSLVLIRKIKVTSENSLVEGEVYFMVCNEEMCLPPISVPFILDLATGKTVDKEDVNNSNSDVSEILPELEKFDLENPINDCGGEENSSNKSLWMIFLLGLGGGLFAVVTPCVYPMIPLTVSFFTKGGQDKGKGLGRAGLYGFFIFLIYISLSIPFHVTDMDPQILNGIATNPYLNIAFFVVFVFFAFSFLGYYELTLPSKWSNKSDSASNRGGFIGIFFMALTLALVSFSCTGPILGSVLAGVLKNGPMPLTVALAGFGLALGLPFAIFAAFPSLMKSIPQSGGWLNSVKVVLGFLELALALKFLSNADLVEQWGLLKREVFFGIWILLGLGLVAYLLNLIRFPHDSKNRKLTFPKVAFAILFLSFTIYLIPGVTCGESANRRLVSGFPPPMFYSYCSDGGKCPLNLDCHKDFKEGRELATNVDKPMLVDFTGWACVSCREVEENIWPDPEVYKLISENFVLVSLYVDDKRVLPEDQQGVVEIKYDNGKVKKKKIKTVGDKWFTFETLVFKNNSQPRYALLAPDGTLLNNPISYKDIRENGYEKFYAEFLRCGLDAYEKHKQSN